MSEPLARRVALLGRHGPDAWAALERSIRQGSPFLRDLIDRDPEGFGELADADPEVVLRGLVADQAAAGRRFAAGELDRSGLAAALRGNRRRQALLVALCDLGGVWSVEQVTAALTAFADASVQGATEAALHEALDAGKLDPGGIGPDGAGCGLTILALGKHGAGELNYSSDIDLVVFFDPTAAALTPGAEPSRLYNRAAQAVVKFLSERTSDGYVHRVDYRLRPDPGSTPAAISLPAAYTYYETVGQNWERAAMIKARPVAGDIALGERFLRDLTPFIWRKYFDFASIADIHAMKRQIHAVRGHGEIAVAGHDIKLGRGGIREIEFFVQTQQLVFGGRRASLRGRRTLDMLGALHGEGWISAGARDELSAAYRFLREIEHRLQMVDDEQTQRLPSDPEALARFAGFAGYPDTASFGDALTGHARRVQHHYGLLFEDAPALASDLGSLVFTGTEDDPATLATLAGLGFRDPARTAETVRGWHFGRRAAITSPRAREVLTELVPPLLQALGGTGDPDGALARLDDAFARMPAAVELLTILRSRERLRLLFADLLGTAPRLAEAVGARPHLLDTVIDPALAEPVSDDRAIEAELRASLGEPVGTEAFLDQLRDAVHRLQFVTGARLLSGILPPREAGAAYAAIARASIRVSLDRVSEVFAQEHGAVPGGRIAVLGLGRLGAGDLTAGSDLDLTVLYDFDPEDRTSRGGPRPLDAVVYYTRLTQRLIAALTVPTRRGRLFDIDMRLRPSGTKGPLASQFSGFRSYHDGEAELWEHMALTRARVLAGDADLGQRLEAAIADIVQRPREQATVYRGVAEMREHVAREKGADQRDLKLARGGILDLDFLAQAVVLAHAAAHPGLAGLSTPEALSEAGRLGLLPEAEVAALLSAHRLLGDVLHWQRLTLGARLDEAERAPALVRRLAGMVGAPDPAAFVSTLEDARRPVAAIFARVLAS
ncbi:bifunctional [glutamine synthetase] adenylyltransferase/[glutamine synthetase]-adenylyl-L-tyrosine phosphorylase [Enterovirga sp.]|uniref:bifunctional [glutamine synthetase] adenylyltransferase/[glutamine synthetase]-adenylyl-L-tyrosine phosphorylase n=1 Tax=Enterovirga sp. TaxID=2026350 RepID=UPI002609B5E9|nr:bifunctional [glutamine synthetase] adenylyltransferase/[glutamine synthetase]-adenylyl-L-tyrosine phosphorylase [Enterovirga sp.]MDB5591373.1 bifunctional [glutamine synthetase] adenylyltransferase/[glutamine synthetase]-adenylyl-L-tyrosine [Enterovirga sp.]